MFIELDNKDRLYTIDKDKSNIGNVVIVKDNNNNYNKDNNFRLNRYKKEDNNILLNNL